MGYIFHAVGIRAWPSSLTFQVFHLPCSYLLLFWIAFRCLLLHGALKVADRPTPSTLSASSRRGPTSRARSAVISFQTRQRLLAPLLRACLFWEPLPPSGSSTRYLERWASNCLLSLLRRRSPPFILSYSRQASHPILPSIPPFPLFQSSYDSSLGLEVFRGVLPRHSSANYTCLIRFGVSIHRLPALTPATMR